MIKPEQLLPSNQKDELWYKNNALYWNATIPLLPVDKINKRLDKASGKIDSKDYTHITNPFNSKQEKSMPAKLENVDIISPIFKQLIGEFIRRPIEGIAFNKNSDLLKQKQKLKHELILESLQQRATNKLIELGLFVPNQTDEQGQPINPPLSPEYIEKEVSNLVEKKTEYAQGLLDYIYNNNQLSLEFKEIFYYYAATGIAISYKDVVNGNIVYKLIKPRGFGYIASDGVRYIEDSEAVKVHYYRSYTDLVAMFDEYEDFTEDIRTDLKNKSVYGANQGSGFYEIFSQHYYGNSYPNRHDVETNSSTLDRHLITHIQWKSLTKIYRVYTKDEFGDDMFVDYDDNYIPLDTDVYDTRICTERHEVFIINNKHIIGGKPVEFGRGDYENPNICPCSYNGVLVQSYLDDVSTIIDTLDVYQSTYNVLKYVIQKTINKSKDKIASIPLSLLNGFKDTSKDVRQIMDKDGTMVDIKTNDSTYSAIAESLYFADATQFLFIDDSELTPERAQVASQLLRQIDLGLGNYIEYLYNYALQIKEEAYETIGFNKGRRAATEERTAVYNARQGQYVGTLLTEELFEDFRLFMEKELLGIVDLGKFVYNNGLKATFTKPDYELTSLEIPPLGLSNSNIGITVKVGGKTREDFETFKAQVMQMGGNNLPLSSIGKIMSKTQNFDSLIRDLEAKEQEMSQMQQQSQQVLNDLERQKLELETRKVDIEEKRVNGELEIKAASVGLQALPKENGTEMIKIANENSKNQQDSLLKLGDLQLKHESEATKRYVADTNFKIAKENKP